MKNKINEAFVISKGRDEKGNAIAFLDPQKAENKDTFKYKDIFKGRGARWNGNGKYWYWFLGKTEDQWRNVFDKMIKPALKDAHQAQDASTEESETSLISSLDAIISDVESATTSSNPEETLTPEDQKKIKNRLSGFKETLVNLDDDEEFKKTMQAITAFKNAQGHPYSFTNTILIWIQNQNASHVMSKVRWSKYNRTVNKDAKAMYVRSPSKNAMRPYSKIEKEKITADFVKNVGKQNYSDLNVGERDRLGVMLRGRFSGRDFDFTPVYDIIDTTPIEGKEDYAKDLNKKKDIKWFEDNMLSDEVKPVYNALMNFAEKNNISINLVDDLGGSRGVSKGGAIDLLKSEGNDVGVTKTLAHEITHEILHQKYVQSKNPELRKYFIGRTEGRDLIEQQAELSAWMILASYGFDLKTTSLNYAAIWGADKDQMVRVFDMVSGVVNYMLDFINKEISTNQNLAETEGNITPATHVTPLDVAKVLGVESDYQEELKKDQMIESFYKLLTKR